MTSTHHIPWPPARDYFPVSSVRPSPASLLAKQHSFNRTDGVCDLDSADMIIVQGLLPTGIPHITELDQCHYLTLFRESANSSAEKLF